jgi:hypothetical protein
MVRAGPPGMTTPIVTGGTAPAKPLNMKGLHCWRLEFSWNTNAVPGSVALQTPPFDCNTVYTLDDPPALKPVESDIVNKTWTSFLKGSCTECDPFPLLNAEIGMETSRGVP